MSNATFAVSNGLLSSEHYKRIGSAVWVFLVLIDMQTSTAGEVNHGKPIPAREIARRLGVTDRIVKAHLHQLEDERYVALKRAQYGFVVTVLNPKKRFRREERKRTSEAPAREEEKRTSAKSQTGTKTHISDISDENKNVHHSSISSNIPPKWGERVTKRRARFRAHITRAERHSQAL